MEVKRQFPSPYPSPRSRENAKPRGKTSGDPIVYRLAQSRLDFEGAFRILQQRYAESGLTPNVGARLRVMPYHLWPSTQVFVALDQNRVIGSVSLVRDERSHGLPMESTYQEAIDGLRAEGLLVGEVCCLCVGSEKSHSSGELFAGLTRIMMFHARHMGLDALVAVVHPRHGKFYRHAMGFSEIGGLSAYRQVGGQPGVPILGQVNDDSRYRDRWKRNYFVGDFSEEELRPHPMSLIDREYFRRHLDPAFQPRERRAA
jgi:hypothetical protein